MSINYIYALLSVLGVSLVSLVGLFTLSRDEARVKKYTFLMLSLAVGALLGDAFIHLIPESIEALATEDEHGHGHGLGGLLVLLGVIIFFIIEKFLHWHHHENDAEEKHIHPVGKLTIFSDGVHNFLDGVIIGASFLVSIPVGVATTIAVILHEIPQEIGDFAVLLHAGYTKKRALFLNFLSALTSILGVLLAFALGSKSEVFTSAILPLAAGGFIYIAIADLIPELQKTKEPKKFALQIFMLLVGAGAMFALTFLE